ncbi:thioredoxin [Buchnera aphidicola (Diuraphis noxia)]|uniref:Thioredoxin n=1 Tax=Buchnera aphidicola subsp. Diuraphis noxia TaxID=118101 RepID=A0A1B2H9B1_BUCDN|nr:thioredoxin TrxA [Buchnera aphidicola]ANZ22767.1 thioredoxin [Buchnera aphidicola (Diuraphis noxia)]
MNKIIELTDQNFKEKVLTAQGFILVDFWAEWCNPCKILASVLNEISEEYSSKIIIGKLNIEKNPNTAPIYSVRSIPTLLLFHNSEVLSTKVGAISKLELKEFLNEYVH